MRGVGRQGVIIALFSLALSSVLNMIDQGREFKNKSDLISVGTLGVMRDTRGLGIRMKIIINSAAMLQCRTG